jgi:hypothetical protein
MTIGRTHEAPAAHALTSTIKRLLDHLGESVLYSGKDLDHIQHTLQRLIGIARKGPKTSEKIVILLENRLDVCVDLCTALQEKMQRLSPCLAGIWERLISTLRQISLANTKPNFNVAEVKKLQQQVMDIDAQRTDGHFVNKEGEIPNGDEEVCDLLRKVLLWSNLVLEREGRFPEPYKALFQRLCRIRNELERLLLTHAWSLRETDLYDYQRELDQIDESRIDGNFQDFEGNPAELYVQRTLLYLIRRSYGYIYTLMVSSEPVSEALLPVYNQLRTLRKCLLEVKESGGVSSPRELYPYSMKVMILHYVCCSRLQI